VALRARLSRAGGFAALSRDQTLIAVLFPRQHRPERSDAKRPVVMG
jgi:hypothetical protein